MLLGAHVSIAGGIFQAVIRGSEIGCSAIQIFTKNQRQWKTPPLTNEQIEQYKQVLANSPIKAVVAHDSYLINLCSPDKNNLHKSRESFILEHKRTQALGISGLVFHPGAHKDLGETNGLNLIAESLNIILEECWDVDTKLLLETTAGQGTALGYSFEQLGQIIQMVDEKDKVVILRDGKNIPFNVLNQKLSEYNDYIGRKEYGIQMQTKQYDDLAIQKKVENLSVDN